MSIKLSKIIVNRKIYTSKDHHIRNHLIDQNALFVLDKLHQAGHTAYLVGGGVRDLLMNKKPKDYDISTSARPEEIKNIFTNCILIGRRFRLAHVRFGKKVLEVSTFRAGDTQDEQLITRDNIWGTEEEDVLRRDFTINGLFYDPQKHEIIDYVGGFIDLKDHLLRSIGDPLIRFKQDPVRMIRFQKFRARFGFHAEHQTLVALNTCRDEIVKSSSARVLEEIFRMLESGASEPFFRLLVESEILQILLPQLASYLQQESGELIYAYLRVADSMNQKDKRTLDRSLLTACLIFPILDFKIGEKREKGEEMHLGSIIELSYNLIHDFLFASFSHFPRRIRHDTHAICLMQYRLVPLDPKGRPKLKLTSNSAFSPALLFLKLRSLINPHLFKTYNFWKNAKHKRKK
ncbi:MAG: polynucleotide adenylyltransferase PcnB [Chlamydiia bacterium]|nr:polynucleotide adenylyltransferase PcnB [Chlamydiia bacterium]